MKSGLAPLHELARAHGVQTSFLAMNGGRVTARPEALIAVLDALEVDARTDRAIQSSLRDRQAFSCEQCLEPVTVAWDHTPTRIRLQLPEKHADQPVAAHLHLEDGTQRRLQRNPTRVATLHSGRQRFAVLEFTLPGLPFGYHQLALTAGSRIIHSLILSAPRRSFGRSAAPNWGVFLPLYAARSERSWGAGNFSDWQQLCDWTASLGGNLVGTLPLLASFLDHPHCDPSPYSPASRLFWNEFYLDITAIPEFQRSQRARQIVGSRTFQQQVTRFQKSRLVDYEAEWQLRRQVLEVLADDFSNHHSPRRQDFECFLQQRPELDDYARFRALCDQTHQSWHSWRAPMRNGRIRDGDVDQRLRDFHRYVQWVTQQQIDALITRCRKRNIEFYLDLPLGVHQDGYDVWRERESFAMKASVGAPPDSFFTLGQNWGFAPPHRDAIRRTGYRYLIHYLRFQMRHTGLLRIDHVMGLHRLYWIPKGFDARDGVYVQYAAEELHAILSIESHRHKTMLVGENLGTVPPEVNDALKRHAWRGMFVVQYQQRPDPAAAVPAPGRRTVASLNTHDLPTFPAHWKGLEIVDHARLGLVSPREVPLKRKDRRELNAALAAFLKSRGWLKGTADLRKIVSAVLAWMGRSRAEIVLVNLEDLLLEELPQNMPGTYKERPNWRRKARVTLDEVFQDPVIRKTLQRLNRARRSTKQAG
jgi:4-alpha-glucanotransferase